MGRLRVLHVIEQLRRGGPIQALIAAKKRSLLPCEIEHHIVSIKPADRRACAQAAEAGIAGTSAPDSACLQSLMADADIVQIHFWNNPEIHALLAADLPPIRLLLWCHVNGATAPHIIPRALLGRSDLVVVSTPSTLSLPAFRTAHPDRVALVASVADFSRLARLEPILHGDFRVGYVGSVEFAKLHDAFAGMCAAVALPSAYFLICGDGSAVQVLKRQTSELGIFERCEFHPHTEDIRPILAQLDVFGYPLSADTSATAELSLQEAMYAGVPPVVFAHGGPKEIVTNGKTGIVVHGQDEYVQSIEWLYRNPRERKQLGENAARSMREHLQRNGCRSDAMYLQLMESSKRPRARITDSNFVAEALAVQSSRGARSFVCSLDGTGDADFLTSLTASNDAQAEEAELRIARTSANMKDVILQYRRCNPSDPHLRLWAGLILREKRPAVAASEFKASLALGCDSERVRRYFLESAGAAGLEPTPTELGPDGANQDSTSVPARCTSATPETFARMS